LDLSGRIQTEQHDYAGAERAFEAELETANTDASARPQALQALGFFLLKRGGYAGARTRLDQALAELEKKTPDGTDATSILEQIAVALLNANDREEANPLIDRATAIYAKQGPKSTELVRSLKLASMCAATDEAKAGRMEAALDLQLQVGKMDAARRSAGIALELDPGSVVGRDALASILKSTGKTAEAVRALRESSQLAAKAYGEDSINVAARRFNLGRALPRNGDAAGGRKAFLTAARSFGARGSVAEEQWKSCADELVRQKEAVERMLLAGRTAAADRPAITLASLQSALHGDEVLVDVYQFDLYGKSKTFDSKYGAVITAHSGAPLKVKLGSVSWRAFRRLPSSPREGFDPLKGDIYCQTQDAGLLRKRSEQSSRL
jgi:tetratricopeptide (TPR) repeat protein